MHYLLAIELQNFS